MNRQKISQMSGKRVQFWPPTRRFDLWNRELPSMNDTYFITESGRRGMIVRNTCTDHQFLINNDHVVEFRSDTTERTHGVFILKSQIVLQYRSALLEPLSR